MLEQIYASTKVITPNPLSNPTQLVFLKGWSALLLKNHTLLDKIFLDGTQANLGTAATSLMLLNRVKGRHAWAVQSGDAPYSYTIYSADETTGQLETLNPLTSSWQPPNAGLGAGDFIDDENGFLLRAFWGGGQTKMSKINLLTGAQIGDLLILGATGFPAYTNMAYAAPGKVMACEYGTGLLAIIDYLNWEILQESTLGEAVHLMAYDCLHSLVIAVDLSWQVRLYTLDVVPVTLSSPAFYPTAPKVTLKIGRKIRVRLTGAVGEVCSGYWVNWELRSPAQGYLEKARSQTDSNGYAWNYYYGPVAGSGSEIFDVSVTV